MPGTTKTHVVHGVQLKGPRSKHKNEPYNLFSIQYPVTETLNASGEKKRDEGERTLVNPEPLGLNPAWLHTRRALLDRATSEAQKATIRSLHTPKFPYWGHLIYNSIQEFNASNTHRCRKLVYDLRHGEADHNVWKNVFKKIGKDLWAKKPEHKRQPIIKYEGQDYCIIDPPLTAKGVQQAQDANAKFRQLEKHMFPMPKRAYVSPLLRAMQTAEYALGHVPEHAPGHVPKDSRKIMITPPEDSYILNNLREKETGNCADILIEEYISRSKKPPKAGTNAKDLEEDDAVQKRAASLHDEIFGMDDSDCIVRVTHSLLIQSNLIGLAVRGGTVLQKFMLAEGGLFAYVVEGKRPNKTAPKKWRDANLETVAKRKKGMVKRRDSAFPNQKDSTTPVVVTIERPILAM
ncbi:hypothetical protein INS49_004003 [Diaporthe citri]|uniref:uncharacterized protein n=1 Tax=Diaporthe citri TaxID=83186 RepID=UPI001C817D72|nr:uncharacterized protein INS49_004003 [Diaporthe citri]KAG6354922.1 hypothetical protein INS49_004003 [Diaporthe citri]